MAAIYTTDANERRKLGRVAAIARAGTILVSVASLGICFSQHPISSIFDSIAAARATVFPPAPEPQRSAESVGNSLADQDGIGNSGFDYDTSQRLSYCATVKELMRYDGCTANDVHELIESMIKRTNRAVNCGMALNELDELVIRSVPSKHRKLAEIAEECISWHEN